MTELVQPTEERTCVFTDPGATEACGDPAPHTVTMNVRAEATGKTSVISLPICQRHADLFAAEQAAAKAGEPDV